LLCFALEIGINGIKVKDMMDGRGEENKDSLYF
jgi:hypothetical protein